MKLWPAIGLLLVAKSQQISLGEFSIEVEKEITGLIEKALG
jgi:hypothetical protein